MRVRAGRQYVIRGHDRAARSPLLAVAALAAVTAGAMQQLGVGRDLELETVDARFRIRGPITPPADVVLVQVDETTLSELQQRWPFPRAQQAQLIDRLAAAKPRAIAIDLQYTEPTTDDDDNALIDAIDNARTTSCSPRPRSTTRAPRTCSAATTSSATSARASAAR